MKKSNKKAIVFRAVVIGLVCMFNPVFTNVQAKEAQNASGSEKGEEREVNINNSDKVQGEYSGDGSLTEQELSGDQKKKVVWRQIKVPELKLMKTIFQMRILEIGL